MPNTQNVFSVLLNLKISAPINITCQYSSLKEFIARVYPLSRSILTLQMFSEQPATIHSVVLGHLEEPKLFGIEIQDFN